MSDTVQTPNTSSHKCILTKIALQSLNIILNIRKYGGEQSNSV